MKQRIENLLRAVVHPESGRNIVDDGVVESVKTDNGHIVVTLSFAKNRDPFALKIKKQVTEIVENEFPQSRGSVSVIIREKAPRTNPQPQQQTTTTGAIGRVVAIASGKGGVGKSTVAANMAVTLAGRGLRVGLLDADIYGPSQPKMFGCEDYMPDAVERDGLTVIVPAESMGVKLMSIGFFVKPTDALMWRGAMAVNALKQMIHQTEWGELDFLLVDLPPGTGDIHLSIINELKIDAAAIVSTPQQIAVADVVRGVEMFRHPQVAVPVAGIIENMAWFTPDELPDNRYYIFGRGGAERYAAENGIALLGRIPVVQSVAECADGGRPASLADPRVAGYYSEVVDNLLKNSSAAVEKE